MTDSILVNYEQFTIIRVKIIKVWISRGKVWGF